MKRAATTKRDAVWDHFTQQDQKWVCNYCGQVKPHRADRLRQHLLACDSVPRDAISELFQRPSQSIGYTTAADAEAYQYVRIETVSLPDDRGAENIGLYVDQQAAVGDKIREAEGDVDAEIAQIEAHEAPKRKRVSDPADSIAASNEAPRTRKRKVQSESEDAVYQDGENDSRNLMVNDVQSVGTRSHVEESRAASASLQRELRKVDSVDS